MSSWTLWLPYKECNGVCVIAPTHLQACSMWWPVGVMCFPGHFMIRPRLKLVWHYFQQGHRAHTGSLGTRLRDEKFQCKHLLAWRQRGSVVCQSCTISGYCNCRLSLLTECNPFTNHSELLQYYHTVIIGSRLDDMLCTRHYISDCKPITDFW